MNSNILNSPHFYGNSILIPSHLSLSGAYWSSPTKSIFRQELSTKVEEVTMSEDLDVRSPSWFSFVQNSSNDQWNSRNEHSTYSAKFMKIEDANETPTTSTPVTVHSPIHQTDGIAKLDPYLSTSKTSSSVSSTYLIDADELEGRNEAKSSCLVANSKKIRKLKKQTAPIVDFEPCASHSDSPLYRDPNSSRKNRKIRENLQATKNYWSHEEDQKLLRLINLHGKKWTKISRILKNRTGKQVRERYLNRLRPDIKTEEWNEEEDKLLQELILTHKTSWGTIAAYLPGRTETQIKNRYYSQRRKEERRSQRDTTDGSRSGNENFELSGNGSVSPMTSNQETLPLFTNIDVLSMDESSYSDSNSNFVNEQAQEIVLRPPTLRNLANTAQELHEADLFISY